MSRVDREGPIHEAIVAFLERVLPPENMVHHSPNEHRRKRGKDAMIHAARNKAKGTKTGFPDLQVLPFAHAFPTMFFEVKAPGNYATKEQKECHEQLRAHGYRVAVVRSVDDVRKALREWSIPTKEVTA